MYWIRRIIVSDTIIRVTAHSLNIKISKKLEFRTINFSYPELPRKTLISCFQDQTVSRVKVIEAAVAYIRRQIPVFSQSQIISDKRIQSTD